MNLTINNVIFKNTQIDHQFSEENELGFYTNQAISLKKIFNSHKINSDLYISSKNDFLKFLDKSKNIFLKNRLGECIFHILKDDNEKALDILSGLHNHKNISKDSFHIWSIFEDLRNNNKFKDIYKKFYKKDFILSQP